MSTSFDYSAQLLKSEWSGLVVGRDVTRGGKMDVANEILNQVEHSGILEAEVCSIEEFFDGLLKIGCSSRAAVHPYFDGMRDGTLPNVLLAITDYAIQKSKLHIHFKETKEDVPETVLPTQPLHGIRVETPKAAPVLINLEQRSISVVNARYEELFERFIKALEREVGEEGLAVLPPVDVGRYFGEEFGQLFESNSSLFVLGVLSIRTYPFIHTIYRRILEGLKKFTMLSPREYFFYQLGSELETPLYDYVKERLKEICKTREDRLVVVQGFARGAACQACYWDRLYKRASSFPCRKLTEVDQTEVPRSPTAKFSLLKWHLYPRRYDNNDLEVLHEEPYENASGSNESTSFDGSSS
eukprot:jgi/Galph1/1061/GphlegSOOS_G5762.1